LFATILKNSTQAVRRGRQYQFTAQKKCESPADIWYGLGLATHYKII